MNFPHPKNPIFSPRHPEFSGLDDSRNKSFRVLRPPDLRKSGPKLCHLDLRRISAIENARVSIKRASLDAVTNNPKDEFRVLRYAKVGFLGPVKSRSGQFLGTDQVKLTSFFCCFVFGPRSFRNGDLENSGTLMTRKRTNFEFFVMRKSDSSAR